MTELPDFTTGDDIGEIYAQYLADSMMQSKIVISANIIRKYARKKLWPKTWRFQRGPYGAVSSLRDV